RRRVGEGDRPVLRADGQLSLRSRSHREEPRSLCPAARGGRFERGHPSRPRRGARHGAGRRLNFLSLAARSGKKKPHDFPYTGTTAPRVTLLSGDARKRIVAATSSTLGQAATSAFGIAARLAGVSMIEGATALTRMSCRATSSASATVSAATAALLAA